MSATKFLTYCGLTNLGGSKKRECKCKGPQDCEMRSHPGFEQYREEAIGRFSRAVQHATYDDRVEMFKRTGFERPTMEESLRGIRKGLDRYHAEKATEKKP